MDFDFRSRTLAPPLDLFVASIWYARGQVAYTRERIAPTGSVVAVFVLGAPIIQTPNDGQGEPFVADRGFLVGPHDRPAINEPTGETYAIGIVATPIGCEASFGVRPSTIRSQAVDLEGAWSQASTLRTALTDCDNPEQQLDCVDACLRAQIGAAGPDLLRCESAVRLLENDPTRPISHIAKELGVSHSHLDRELAKIVGLSPRSLSRLLRLRRLLSGIDVNESIHWADLAAQYGWFDQSHFIRDFKRHTGVVPSQYVAAQRTLFSKGEIVDAAGFVPEA